MRTPTPTLAALTLLLMSGASTLYAGQKPFECREGTGDLGIGRYLCDGGDCTVSEHLKDGRVIHRFSVEPRVRAIDPKGASAGKLKENDVIVAVDGSLVTTFEGGYKLANAKIGVAVVLRIRRDNKELEVRVVPGKGCNLPALTVTE